jgi:hypothetical protein
VNSSRPIDFEFRGSLSQKTLFQGTPGAAIDLKDSRRAGEIVLRY